MKLDDYLTQSGMTPYRFAKQIGCNPSLVYRWISGEARPDWKYLPVIEEATQSLVAPQDFY